MRAVVLETVNKITIRDIDLPDKPGPRDVRIKPLRVGICGSDVHYYLHGKIGSFIVNEPMVLGHEMSGVVAEVGSEVKSLKKGDRVCAEPGIPDLNSAEYRKGMYNLDPAVRFWATPPIHGCLCEEVIHPEQFTYKLPDNVSLEEGALVEPLAIGVHAAKKAHVVPGDSAIVCGAGTIGIVTGLAAFASGCSSVLISDVKPDKLEFVEKHYKGKLKPVDLRDPSAKAMIAAKYPHGFDVLFEASGSPAVISNMTNYVCPGGRIVLVGMPIDKTPVDIVGLEAKEICVASIFRYANVFDRTLQYISSGQMNVKPLNTHTFKFKDALEAFEFASKNPAGAVKIMIDMENM